MQLGSLSLGAFPRSYTITGWSLWHGYAPSAQKGRLPAITSATRTTAPSGAGIPNLQTVRVSVDGAVKRIRVCTQCLKSNRIKKAS